MHIRVIQVISVAWFVFRLLGLMVSLWILGAHKTVVPVLLVSLGVLGLYKLIKLVGLIGVLGLLGLLRLAGLLWLIV